MLEKLQQLAYRFSRKREKQTEYDGFLSYAGEFHALAVGLAVGGASAIYAQPEIAATLALVATGIKPAQLLGGRARRIARRIRAVGKADEKASLVGELRREPWYSVGGVVLGYVTGAIIGPSPAARQAVLDLVNDVVSVLVLGI